MHKQRMVAPTGNVSIIRWINTCLTAAVFSLLLSTLSITTLSQTSSYEGDVTPRPNGKNGAISAADYQQIGRFASQLDSLNAGSELQRADCAPRTTLGDGKVGTGDLVQAMRYAAGLDPLTAVGGPTAQIQTAVSHPNSGIEAAREVKVGVATYGAGTVTIPIELVAQGDENALGFTIAFDATALSNPVVVLGTDAASALLIPNPNQVTSGRLGIIMGLPANQVFAAGTKQLLRITFNVAQNALGTQTPIGFASSPVPLEISDKFGILLDQRIFTGAPVTLNIPVPAITSLSPGTKLAGDPQFTLGVIGSNFVNTSVIRWNGIALATTFISNTLLTAVVPAANIATAGSASVTVFNGAPGGGLSNALAFAINNPVPGITGFSTSTILAGGAGGTFDVFGNGFVPGSIVYWNGRACPTRYISGSRLIVDYVATDIACAGRINVTIVSPPPGGGTSILASFSIAPVVSSFNPTIAYVGGGNFTLTVTGTGFCEGARIRWNGVPRASTIVSNTQITTIITAADLLAAGSFPISVVSSDGVASNAVSFPVSSCTPAAARVTLASALDFGTTFAARELVALNTRPSQTFTVENTGCQNLTFSFGVNRTLNADQVGKITNTDDSGTFIIRNITNGADQEIRAGSIVTIPGFARWTFRVVFDPKIPAPAGGTTNLAAAQIIPDIINSVLTITSSGITLGNPTLLASATLTGRVDANSRFINPFAPRLAPLVVFKKTGADEYTVEVSGYDPNSNIHLFAYQFYDASNNRVGQAPNFDIDLSKVNILKGQSFSIVKKFSANECGQNATTVQAFFYDREDYASATSLPVGTGTGRFLSATSVSAASYTQTGLASDSIAAAFGEKFGDETAVAQATPLPTELGNVRIFVTDSNKVERPAQLFFVSPNQINYLIPECVVAGEAKVTVAYKGQVVSSGTMMVNDMAPGLFTANSDGTGAPAAYAVRVKPDNSQSNEPVYQYDQAQKRFVTAPINIGTPDEQVFLVLFGTGIRNRTTLSNVTAKIAGVDSEVLYAGAHGFFVGVDQVNLRVPRSLLVSGEVDLVLSVDGKPANTVRVYVK